MSSNGALAQLVEHRTENPCVPGSIPGGTTPPFIIPVIRKEPGFFMPFTSVDSTLVLLAQTPDRRG